MEDDAVFCAKCGNRPGQEQTNIQAQQPPRGQVIKGVQKKPPPAVFSAVIVAIIIAGVFLWMKSSGGGLIVGGLIDGDYTDPLAGDMVYVKGGTLTMGCTPEQGNDCHDNEHPAHQVTLDDYYIGKYEVTQAQW